MKSCFFLGSLWIAMACCLTAGADSRSSPAANGDVQNIVFFSESRPVLIRLHTLGDGKSSQAAWDEFLHDLLSYLDTDKNGILSQEEAARTPPAQVLTSNIFLYPGQFALVSPLDSPQPNRNGQITIEELRQYYFQSGAPFQVHVQPGQARAVVLPGTNRNVNQSLNAVALDAALNNLLDTNHDGHFSREELNAAPVRLLPRDADDDEMVTGQEISLEPDRGGFRMFQVLQSAASSRGPGSAFLVLAPGESSTNLAERLLKRYGKQGATPDRMLTRHSSGLDEASFNQLDRNGDGALDSEELAGFAYRLPDVELTIDIRMAIQPEGDSASKVVGAPAARLDGVVEVGPLRLTTRLTALSVNARAAPGGGSVLSLGPTTLDLRVGGSSTPQDRTPASARDTYKTRFGDTDQDKNGYLDANEARSFAAFGALFKLMDVDSNGKLTENELLAYFDKMIELRAQVAASCAGLSVVDDGSGLFNLFDPNGDGRLSVRELRQAASSLDSQDRNRDGFVGRDEIPHSYVATFVRGAVDMTPVFRGMMMNTTLAQSPALKSTPVRGPLWSRKMDRNQDGDVSRREFVGTDEQFSRIDADGDGLISGEEAEQDSIDVFRKAVKFAPNAFVAQGNLGFALAKRGDAAEAITAFHRAVETNGNDAEILRNVGSRLKELGDVAGAITAYRKALGMEPIRPELLLNLAVDLKEMGLFADALVAYRRAHELGSKQADWKEPTEKYVQQCERLVELDRVLPRIIAGDVQPASPAEALEFTIVCRRKRWYGTAVQLYTQAFQQAPELTTAVHDNSRARFLAACAAVLAGSGRGEDPTPLDDADQRRCRDQALQWLRDHLNYWEDRLATGQSTEALLWPKNPELAVVRDADLLAKLPTDEQVAWRKLWADVTDFLDRRQKKLAASTQ